MVGLAVMSILAITIPGIFCEKVVWCYYGSWATYRSGNGKCDLEHLDPFLCTHLVYIFAGLNIDGTVKVLDPWLDLPDNFGRDNYRKFNSLKEINPNLKTILAVGGWNEGSYKYSLVANSPQLRSRFANHAADFLIRYGFDGLDFDWAYPGQRDSIYGPQDVDAYTLLLKELRQVFDRRQPGLLLAAAVAPVAVKANLSYNIPEISKHLNFINLMTYDLYGPWDTVTGHNAALYPSNDNVSPSEALTVDAAVKYWIGNGAPREKLLLGLPLFEHTFTLANSAEDGVGAASSGPGLAGIYSQQPGTINLNELVEMFNPADWKKYIDRKAKVSYASRGRDWISIDDADALSLKAEFALANGLAGIMIWSLEMDDFRGILTQSGEKYPMVKLIKAAINGNT